MARHEESSTGKQVVATSSIMELSARVGLIDSKLNDLRSKPCYDVAIDVRGHKKVERGTIQPAVVVVSAAPGPGFT